ncbi:MAG TPA: hypothetical protein VHM30_01840 [Gemmatimonadaceae bacterium]|nr:hypothetical protein [Gemmatimonadaceae bacterium]
MTSPRHFVSVWNPSYAHDAMEQHLQLLLAFAAQRRADAIDADDVYVWWGKVRSGNRLEEQKHLDDARAIAAELDDGARDEVQLYLTDYRSLYVADVEEIQFGELPEAEREHVPAYYAEQRLNCDYWWRVNDIRRLVADDLQAVIRELKPLKNEHYHGKSVSLYGGMVDLPLFVTRSDGRRFFERSERDLSTGGELWAELDARVATGVATIERELRDNVIGETAWLALEPTTRTFIATGENDFRAHRADPAYDFGAVIVSFAKALEVQINTVLRRAVAKMKPASRLAKVGGRTVDLAEHGSLVLGDIVQVLTGEPALAKGLAETITESAWFTGTLPVVLDALRTVRNQAAHGGRVDRATATHWRNRLLGVGSEGELVALARVRMK